MAWLVAFARFWYRFVVGDDWTIAAALLVGLAATGLLHRGGAAAWWLLPLVAVGALAASLWRAQRASA